MLIILPNEDNNIQQVQSNLEQFDIQTIKDRLAKVNKNFGVNPTEEIYS